MKAVLEGATLSGGNSTVAVTSSNGFRFFVHEDSRTPVLIPLSLQNIKVENHLVVFGRGPIVSVVEHLFSALYGLGVYDVRIDVHGNALPFFDGSSKRFADMLQPFNEKKPVDAMTIHERLDIREAESFICYEPTDGDRLYIEMELRHPFIQTQRIELAINKESYLRDIAPARTFVFTSEEDPRLRNLPPYGIGITRTKVYSAEPLRFPDELVRHKVLDLLGDLYILRRRITGKITACNTSHRLNLQFVRAVSGQKGIP
ncbi:MAG: UDP-3-O-acyl-N-acetylglucosamine deacetylase [candidate division WOR-3 bacterium]|nr:MAG: UDP-3-O-acyl-N-acetylglucosamine deacetylase [candidate division WOR-3 bacterium]